MPPPKRSIVPDATPLSRPVKVVTLPSPDENLSRENAYLKQRNAQLQSDVTAIGAEAERLRQIVERLHGRRVLHLPDPLGSGQ